MDSAVSPPDVWRSLALLGGGCLLWLLCHAYVGFDYHDARIYAVLALHWLNPTAYARDPFFLFGSQDSYSLFSPVYGGLIALTSLPTAAKCIMLLAGATWVLAAHGLWRRLGASSLLGAAAMLAMVCLTLSFSPNGNTFTLNEAFPTARSWAMPLGALALVAWLGGHVWLGGLLAMLASLMHPLFGIWVLATGGLYWLPWGIGVGGYLGLLGLTLLLGWLGWGPFVWLERDWLAFLRANTWDLLPAVNNGFRHDAMLSCLLLLACAGSLCEVPARRRLYCAVTLVAAGGLALSLFCTYLAPAALLVKAQPWRSMWLAFLLLPFALAQCCTQLWSFGDLQAPWYRRPLALLVLLALPVLFMFPTIWALCGVVAVLTSVMRSPSLHTRLQRHHTGLAVLAAGLSAVALPSYWLELALLGDSLSVVGATLSPVGSGLLVMGGWGPGFVLVAGSLFVLARLRWAVLLLALPLFALLTAWDARPAGVQAIDAALRDGNRGPLGAYIKPGEVVLSAANKPLPTWYQLGTAHYASPVQATGRVFSREKSEELLRRAAHVRAAVARADVPVAGPMLPAAMQYQDGDPFDFPAPTAAAVPALCRDAALDWVLINDDAPGGIVVKAAASPRQWTLFRCAR